MTSSSIGTSCGMRVENNGGDEFQARAVESRVEMLCDGCQGCDDGEG